MGTASPASHRQDKAAPKRASGPTYGLAAFSESYHRRVQNAVAPGLGRMVGPHAPSLPSGGFSAL